MITFIIDELVPCLKSTETGELYETEVVRIKRKSVLMKYNISTGWYVNWNNFSKEIEIYALVLKGTFDVQGLIAVSHDTDMKATKVIWACVAPENNINKYGKKKYIGVGGHLLAIASELSVENGYDGYIVGEAINKFVFDYYCNEFDAQPLPSFGNPYRFMLDEFATEKLRRIYTYEWTNEVL